MKKIVSILLMTTMTLLAWADAVTFEASAPAQVIVGQSFPLRYTINQEGRELRAPEMNGFTVLAGPYSSQSSSSTYVNGQWSNTFTQMYTYTLSADKEGTYTIGPATIKVNGTQYRSNGVKITVLPQDKPSAQPSAGQSAQQQQAATSQADQGGASEVFIRTLASKTHIREQECVLLTYKMYWRNMGELGVYPQEVNIPEFKGFLKQEIEQGESQVNLEHYNDKNYSTAVVHKVLLFPQKTGDIEIEPATFSFIFRVRTRMRSFFDEPYTDLTKKVKAQGVTIHVEPLPAGKPANYSSGVGNFEISSSITSQNISTNDAVTIRLTISGKGNMKMIKTPTVDWPEAFEAYDPKVSNNFKNSTSGVTGKKEIEYLAIARAAGDYTIPPIEFAYFDLESDSYKTLRTPEYTVHIARGASDEANATVVQNYAQKEDIRQLGNDIHHIKTGKYIVAKNTFVGGFSGMWWLWYVCPLALTILALIIFRKKIKENSDLTRVRYKKANKVAQKRLKQAKRLLQEAESGVKASESAFYEEIERAAWQYLSDRLSIPTAELTKDNIAEILSRKGVSDELISKTKNMLSTAEFARYAPSAAGSKTNLYEETVELIDKLEDTKI